ncbi:MAG: D-2-hydroxyacid dehydrogenase [Anaerolineales bacterium]|nr:D-2-hydroxyacid dehydrogenase [Anaerolineales bacterium]
MTEALEVLITLKLDDETLDRLRQISPFVKLRVHVADKGKDVPNRVWSNVDVLFTGTALPPTSTKTNVKWIHSMFAGVDNVLDDPFVKANPEIVITSSSGIHVSNIGEYVLGMILALGHRIPRMMQHQTRAEWHDERFKLFMPQELSKSTVGILGYGRIGREVARLCKAFGATVLATKRNVKTPADHRYTLPGTGDAEGEMYDRLYPPEASGFMIKECDFVVITLPITDKTRMSFGKALFNAMKPSAFLINVGRGGIVDENELLTALQEGQIAGAAFDVFATEPLPHDHPLWKAPNLIISPHIAGNMDDYRLKATSVFEDNLRRYLEKQPLLNIVSRELGY